MIVIRVFGFFILLLGGFIAYGVIGSSLPILFGERTEATIITVEKVKDKRFTYLYYPVIQFSHNSKLLKITDKSSDISKDKVNTKLYIYYSEKYGISRGFSAIEVVFSIMSIGFIFGGSLMLFKRNELYLS